MISAQSDRAAEAGINDAGYNIIRKQPRLIVIRNYLPGRVVLLKLRVHLIDLCCLLV